jgi:hypothetical protein
MPDFDRAVLGSLESLFAPDELEVLYFRPDTGEFSHAVKVIHKPTGIEVVADDFDSQIKNKSIALISLLSELRSS